MVIFSKLTEVRGTPMIGKASVIAEFDCEGVCFNLWAKYGKSAVI